MSELAAPALLGDDEPPTLPPPSSPNVDAGSSALAADPSSPWHRLPTEALGSDRCSSVGRGGLLDLLGLFPTHSVFLTPEGAGDGDSPLADANPAGSPGESQDTPQPVPAWAMDGQANMSFSTSNNAHGGGELTGPWPGSSHTEEVTQSITGNLDDAFAKWVSEAVSRSEAATTPPRRAAKRPLPRAPPPSPNEPQPRQKAQRLNVPDSWSRNSSPTIDLPIEIGRAPSGSRIEGASSTSSQPTAVTPDMQGSHLEDADLTAVWAMGAGDHESRLQGTGLATGVPVGGLGMCASPTCVAPNAPSTSLGMPELHGTDCEMTERDFD